MQQTSSISVPDPEKAKLLTRLNGPGFNLHLLSKLPSAFFMGVRIKHCDTRRCEVTVPFWWGSQNPFKSVYFAAQNSAAELSTGALALTGIAGNGKYSMLIIESTAKYFKKAKSKITFICEDGELIQQAISDADESGEGTTFKATSRGYLSHGDLASEMTFTWSFLKRPED